VFFVVFNVDFGPIGISSFFYKNNSLMRCHWESDCSFWFYNAFIKLCSVFKEPSYYNNVWQF